MPPNPAPRELRGEPHAQLPEPSKASDEPQRATPARPPRRASAATAGGLVVLSLVLLSLTLGFNLWSVVVAETSAALVQLGEGGSPAPGSQPSTPFPTVPAPTQPLPSPPEPTSPGTAPVSDPGVGPSVPSLPGPVPPSSQSGTTGGCTPNLAAGLYCFDNGNGWDGRSIWDVGASSLPCWSGGGATLCVPSPSGFLSYDNGAYPIVAGANPLGVWINAPWYVPGFHWAYSCATTPQCSSGSEPYTFQNSGPSSLPNVCISDAYTGRSVSAYIADSGPAPFAGRFGAGQTTLADLGLSSAAGADVDSGYANAESAAVANQGWPGTDPLGYTLGPSDATPGDAAYWVSFGLTTAAPGQSCTPTSAGPSYQGAVAAAYASQYAGLVGSDGYFWTGGGTYGAYAQGTSTAAIESSIGGTGDDCTHFASLVLQAGGLSIPSSVPPTYGIPGVAALRSYLLSNNLATDAVEPGSGASVPSWMQPGDLIMFEWGGAYYDGQWDHTAVYLGNGQIAQHSYGDPPQSIASWTENIPVVAYDFVHIAGNSGAGSPGGGDPWQTASPCPYNLHLNNCPIGMARTQDGKGYWIVATDGGVFSFGDAAFYGSMGGHALNAPMVGMAATPDGKGYWLVGADGGVFAFGDAGFYGSMAGHALNQPVVGITPTPDGQGYWLVAGDGGVFSFGDAGFYGSMGGQTMNAPVVGIASTHDGKGYWLVGADGGIFSFGDAVFYGSLGGVHLNAPVVGITATPDGKGYWLVASDGGIFTFGDAPFHGSMGSTPMNAPVAGMADSADGNGYWLVGADGGIFSFGDAPFEGCLV